MSINIGILYCEKVSPKKTAWLFIVLTLVFILLFAWCVSVNSWNSLATVFLVLSCIFFFDVVNYRTLIVRITSDSLKLSFGIFSWTVPLANVESCSLDEIPALMKYGGAGIHFMMIRKRYRASFNFLEYPRVVIAFKNKVGPVRDISFSTRRPEEILGIIQEAIFA